MNRHLVVIGDIVDSRRMRNRAAFQRQFAEALHGLSPDQPSLASPYTLTLGDEFQAVYRRAGGLFADLCRVRIACLPARVRLVVAVGEIKTAINPTQALGMDGPAFHLARARVDALKADGGWFDLDGDAPGTPDTRRALIDLVCAGVDSWQPNRWRILLGMLEGKSAGTCAKEIGISEPAVYKNINHGRLESLVTLLHEVEAALDARLKRKP
jgi:hypothetical protein